MGVAKSLTYHCESVKYLGPSVLVLGRHYQDVDFTVR